jgi:hypothetical protein
MLDKVRDWLPERLRELLLLERAEKAAQAFTPEQQAKVRALALACDRRRSAAEVLSDEEHLPVALQLGDEAAKLALAAVLVANGRLAEGADLDAGELEKSMTAMLDAGELEQTQEMTELRSCLSVTDPLAFDDLSVEQATQRRELVKRAGSALRARVDPRTVQEIRLSRRIRVVVTALVVVTAVVWGAVWGVVKIVSPVNIAYHKPVTMSSRWPNQPSGSGPEGLAPAGLTDGTKNGSFGICTREEVNPWAVVDLGRERAIGRIVVYNRDDCCQGHLPVLLELSNDGTTFTEVGRRTEIFTESKPWTLKLSGKSGRYIRVRIEGPAVHVLSLSELEAFAPRK